MAVNIKAIKGTKDTLPSESYKSQYIEQAALDIAKTYGFHEMRTPVLNIQSFLTVLLVKQLTLFKKKCTPSMIKVTDQ